MSIYSTYVSRQKFSGSAADSIITLKSNLLPFICYGSSIISAPSSSSSYSDMLFTPSSSVGTILVLSNPHLLCSPIRDISVGLSSRWARDRSMQNPWPIRRGSGGSQNGSSSFLGITRISLVSN